jgi:hypothetical protein
MIAASTTSRSSWPVPMQQLLVFWNGFKPSPMPKTHRIRSQEGGFAMSERDGTIVKILGM